MLDSFLGVLCLMVAPHFLSPQQQHSTQSASRSVTGAIDSKLLSAGEGRADLNVKTSTAAQKLDNAPVPC